MPAPEPPHDDHDSLARAPSEEAFLTRVRSLVARPPGGAGLPIIRGYEILSPVGEGAQGVVYRAVQQSTARIVAIKVLMLGPHASPRRRARAQREAEISAGLSHPNIVTVYESRQLADDSIAVVMEFVEGVPIDRWSAPGETLSARRRNVLGVFAAVCSAVHHAHLNRVIHRDLKPENILVTADGRPVVLDFGIAQALSVRTTLTGEFAGTPAYCSPEQVSGKPADVDALTDVYSLGVILYRLLCRELPYLLEGSLLDVARSIAESPPIPPRTVDPTIPPDLEAIMLCALRKDKAGRYQSAAALGRDVDRYLSGEAVEARQGSGWYVLRKAVATNRRTLAWAGSLAATVMLAALTIGLSVARASESARRAEEQRRQAHLENVRARAVSELLRATSPVPDSEAPDVENAYAAGLRRLYYRLETGDFTSDPELDQEIRRMWGSLNAELAASGSGGLVPYAEVSLRTGLARLRALQQGDNAETASTMYQLAAVLRVRHRSHEALPLAEESLRMRAVLFGDDSLEVGETRLLLARVLGDLGRFDDALRHAGHAEQVLSGSNVEETGALAARAQAVHARVALEGGRPAGVVEPLMREALVRVLRTVPVDDPEAISVLLDAARLVEVSPNSDVSRLLCEVWQCEAPELGAAIRNDAGLLAGPRRPRPAPHGVRTRSDALRAMARLQSGLLGGDAHALAGTWISVMLAAEYEGRSALKIEAALAAADNLSAHFGPNDPRILACLDEAGVSLLFSGDASRGAQVARRAWELRKGGTIAGDALVCGNSHRIYAWALALSGRYQDALSEYDDVIGELTAAVGAGHYLVALARSSRAFCRAELGDVQTAAEESADALAVLRASVAASNDQVAHACFIRGHILERLGRDAEARECLDQAWDLFYQIARSDFLWNRLLIEGMVEVCGRLGDDASAALWRARLNTP